MKILPTQTRAFSCLTSLPFVYSIVLFSILRSPVSFVAAIPSHGVFLRPYIRVQNDAWAKLLKSTCKSDWEMSKLVVRAGNSPGGIPRREDESKNYTHGW